jgi:hypothetical protein
MKRRVILAVPVLAFFFFTAMGNHEDVPLGVRIAIAPSSQDDYQLLRRRTRPDTYTCRAHVYDATDEAYGFTVSEVIVAAGERETKTDKVGDLEVTFTVAVGKDSNQAATEVTAKRGGKIVLDQHSDVMLRVPGRT